MAAGAGDVPIVQFWGEGLLASVDGLRFVVPEWTVSAALGLPAGALPDGAGQLGAAGKRLRH
ncbi:hypothetical protein ACOBQB_10430 [Streptomyces sp. G5(2025)]|uniref:hypothetical protein n=1 Tax=Streptomyces sp. G5(2025) TaxID=3406628 RepID=UPI003C22BAEA